MKKRHAIFGLLLFVAALALGVSLVAVTPAAATQQWATQTGKPCGYCHVNPNGGGTRTAAGNAFLANGHVLPTVTTVAPTTITTVRATTTTTVGPTTTTTVGPTVTTVRPTTATTAGPTATTLRPTTITVRPTVTTLRNHRTTTTTLQRPRPATTTTVDSVRGDDHHADDHVTSRGNDRRGNDTTVDRRGERAPTLGRLAHSS